MKAAVCREFGRPLCVEELDLAPPQAGEIMVKLAACAICHSDIHYLEGAWGGSLPAVYGHEAAGTVAAVGPEVSQAAVGEPVIVTLLRCCGACFFCKQEQPHLCEGVCALDRESRLRDSDGRPVVQGLRTGAFAEYVVVHQSQVMPVPPSLPMDQAALLACGVITGSGAVTNTAQVPAGASVVVIGAGGVGLNSVQGAAIAGADPIIAVDVAASKCDAARALGASHALMADSPDLAQKVAGLTDGRGADYVFVTVGSVTAIEQALPLLRSAGTLVIVGMPAVGAEARLKALDFANRGQRILGSKMGSTRLPVDIPRLVALYEQGRLKLADLITKRYPLAQINEAIADVKQGEALRNVIIF